VGCCKCVSTPYKTIEIRQKDFVGCRACGKCQSIESTGFKFQSFGLRKRCSKANMQNKSVSTHRLITQSILDNRSFIFQQAIDLKEQHYYLANNTSRHCIDCTLWRRKRKCVTNFNDKMSKIKTMTNSRAHRTAR
jgi:hypothetical protein